MPGHLHNWKDKYDSTRPRRLLACDGGGIKGIISLEILKKIEKQLAEQVARRHGDETRADFRLGDYFDYIAGTSTGAIIATGLAIGMTVDELTDFYVEAGPMMFEKEHLIGRLRRWYKSEPLEAKLKDVLGERTLGSADLRCLLLIVTQNATTGSLWPVSNNPFAKYNDRGRADCNLQIPLWQLVRASTAAPVFFPPELLEWQEGNPDKSFVFVDGGITPYNNPAFLLYRHVVGTHYGLGWQTGECQMMLVSVGTGSADQIDEALGERGHLLHNNAMQLPSTLMTGAAVDQDINCRTFGRCVFGPFIDRELGDMQPRDSDPVAGKAVSVDTDCGRAFLYARYDPDVSSDGLTTLGLEGEVEAAHVQAMDKVEYLADMRRVGSTYAERWVDMAPFERFVL